MTAEPRAAPAMDRGATKSVAGMVARGGAWFIIGRMIRTGGSLVGVAILARLLTPSDFGVLMMATTTSLAALVMLEGVIDIPILRHDALSEAGLRSMIWTGLALMTALSLLVWVAAPAIERAMHFPRLALGLRAIAPVYVLQVFTVAGTAMLRRRHHFRAAALINAAVVFLYLVPAVLLALAGWGLWSVLIGQELLALGSAILCASIARLPLLPPRRLELVGLGATGGYGAAARILEFCWTSVDTLGSGIALGPQATGFYTRAYSLGTQFKEPFQAFDPAIRQGLVKLKTGQDFERQLARLLRLLTLASGCIAGAVIAMRYDLVGLLLGKQWHVSARILGILLMSLPARVALLLLDGATATAGRMRDLAIRHASILALVATGVALFAQRGVEAIAMVMVAGGWSGLLIALLLHADGRPARVGRMSAAIAPGLLAGAALYVLLSAIGTHLAAAPGLERIVAQLFAMLAFNAALAAALPASWLGSALGVRRRALTTTLFRRP